MTNEREKSDFCSRLEQIIFGAGVEKKMFAKMCGISANQLHNYLNGSQEPGSKFYRGLKKRFPEVSLDWLFSGIGEPYIAEHINNTGSVVELRHERIIRQFGNKEFAAAINEALVALEKLSANEFYRIGGYIQGQLDSLARQSLNEYRNGITSAPSHDDVDRRSGKDRRKASGED